MIRNLGKVLFQIHLTCCKLVQDKNCTKEILMKIGKSFGCKEFEEEIFVIHFTVDYLKKKLLKL